MVLCLLFLGRDAEVLELMQQEYRSGVPAPKMREVDATGAPPGCDKWEQTTNSRKKNVGV